MSSEDMSQESFQHEVIDRLARIETAQTFLGNAMSAHADLDESRFRALGEAIARNTVDHAVITRGARKHGAQTGAVLGGIAGVITALVTLLTKIFTSSAASATAALESAPK